MAIKYLSDFSNFIFSPMQRPSSIENVQVNVLRFSIWGALVTGCLASASAIYSRVVIEKNDFAPHVFKRNLILCGTFTVFATFLIYKVNRLKSLDAGDNRALQKNHAHIVSLENGLIITSSILASTAILLIRGDALNPGPVIKSLAERSVEPLMCVWTTAVAIKIFHVSQRLMYRNTKK